MRAVAWRIDDAKSSGAIFLVDLLGRTAAASEFFGDIAPPAPPAGVGARDAREPGALPLTFSPLPLALLAVLFPMVGDTTPGVEEPSLTGVLAVLAFCFLERGVYLYPGYRFCHHSTSRQVSHICERDRTRIRKARLLTMCSSFNLRASARKISFFSSGRSSHNVPTITLTSEMQQ